MALYLVKAKSISYVSVLVKADNEDQAREFAENLYGGEFDEDDGGWEWDDTYEVNEDELTGLMKYRHIWNANED